jgi:hypothetical protein
MNFNRRSFLKTASTLAAFTMAELSSLSAAAEIKTDGKTIEPDDEAYWRNVRQLFPLSKDLTYLNNGTFGPSPF